MRIRRYRFLFTKKSLFIFFLLLTIPITYFAIQQVQDIRNRAAVTEENGITAPYVPGEVIVKLKQDAPALSRQPPSFFNRRKALIDPSIFSLDELQRDSVPSAFDKIDARFQIDEIQQLFYKETQGRTGRAASELKSRGLDKVYKIKVSEEAPIEEIIAELSFSDQIEFAEPNYIVTAQETPNDPDFDKLWGLNNTGVGGVLDADIDAPEAWDISKGDPSIVVAVIDTGVDMQHPDLASNIWINDDEIPNNGIDDDANGFVDDVNGWDFVNKDNDPTDDAGHGTHVAGTIAAVGGNATGVVGVAPNTRIMPLKFLSAKGSGAVDAAAAAIIYSVENGAQISSNSWGGGGPSLLFAQAINLSMDSGQLFVAAAGNDGERIDGTNYFPATISLPNILTVASSTRYDALSYFSNYGTVSVDLAAPGSEIFSTVPGGRYDYKNGTSMATPHVSGVVALLWAQFPSMGYQEVKNRIIFSADLSEGYGGYVFSGGRLNAHRALTGDTNDVIPNKVEWTTKPNGTLNRPLHLYNSSAESTPWTVESENLTWIKISETSGIISPGGTATIELTIDTKELYPDRYQTEVIVTIGSKVYRVPIDISITTEYYFPSAKSVGGTGTDKLWDTASDSQHNVYTFTTSDQPLQIGNTSVGIGGTADGLLMKYDFEGSLKWFKC